MGLSGRLNPRQVREPSDVTRVPDFEMGKRNRPGVCCVAGSEFLTPVLKDLGELQEQSESPVRFKGCVVGKRGTSGSWSAENEKDRLEAAGAI